MKIKNFLTDQKRKRIIYKTLNNIYLNRNLNKLSKNFDGIQYQQ